MEEECKLSGSSVTIELRAASEDGTSALEGDIGWPLGEEEIVLLTSAVSVGFRTGSKEGEELGTIPWDEEIE